MRLVFALFLLILFPIISMALTEDEKLDRFLKSEWDWSMESDPITASYIGDKRWNDRLPDYSVERTRKSHQHDIEARKALTAIDREKLTAIPRLNYDLYLQKLDLNIEGHQYPDYLMPINQLGGIHQYLPELGSQLVFSEEKDYRDYIKRLHAVPRAIDETIATMREGLKTEIVPPKIAVREIEKQILAQVVKAPEQSPFWEPFKEFPADVRGNEAAIKDEASRAIMTETNPAFERFAQFWKEEYFPKTRTTTALSALPNGKNWYTFAAKSYTTTNLTPEQIHEIGQSEVKRIRAEMDKIIAQVKFKGRFPEFLQFLRSDPQFYYKKPEELLTAYRDICKRIDAALPKFFGNLPRNSYGVKEIPAYSAPSQTTAYYTPGSLDAGRSGTFYANTYRLEMRPKWEMEALSIHEAVPGHHLQISIAQELQNVPEFRKFTGYTAFVEGWGLYSESLGTAMGFYEDPYSHFGQLTYEMWRAVRLVVDTGMHYFGWDRQKAIDFFKSNSSKPGHDIVIEIDRYLVIPGQALAYKIGDLKIKELRNYAEEELGDKFDIREFHDRILENGAVPLSIMEDKIKTYVAAKKRK